MSHRLLRIGAAENEEAQVGVGQDVLDQSLNPQVFRLEGSNHGESWFIYFGHRRGQAVVHQGANRHRSLIPKYPIVSRKGRPTSALHYRLGRTYL
jgi:hypothetical protein